MRIKIFLFVFLCIIFGACENNDSLHISDEMASEKSTPQDSSVVYINTTDDLTKILNKKAKKDEDSLVALGWKKIERETPISRARISVRTDTIYQVTWTVDVNIDPSIYSQFNARFSKSMVDSINSYVAPYLRISTKQTYVCKWRTFSAYYNLKDKEKCAPRNSPYCALSPETKNGYSVRGYSSYTNNYRQFMMTSYQLIIIGTRESRTALDIEWPFMHKNTNPKKAGYEFIFAIMKPV